MALDLKKLIRKATTFDYNEKIDDVFRYMQEKNESICLIYKENNFYLIFLNY